MLRNVEGRAGRGINQRVLEQNGRVFAREAAVGLGGVAQTVLGARRHITLGGGRGGRGLQGGRGAGQLEWRPAVTRGRIRGHGRGRLWFGVTARPSLTEPQKWAAQKQQMLTRNHNKGFQAYIKVSDQIKTFSASVPQCRSPAANHLEQTTEYTEYTEKTSEAEPSA